MDIEDEARIVNLEMTVERLVAENDWLKDSVRGLLYVAKMRPELPGRKLPPPADLTNIKAQVFHDPLLSVDQRKRKGVWSLRLTAWVKGIKVASKDEINVALYPRQEFLERIEKLAGDVKLVMGMIELASNDDWLGMIRETTHRKGSPYVRNQLCLLRGHPPVPADQPPDQLRVLICDDTSYWCIDEWRPSAGTKEGRSLWWGEFNQRHDLEL